MPRQENGAKELEGQYRDKLRQIGAIGLMGDYVFTTIEVIKRKNVKDKYSDEIFLILGNFESVLVLVR